MTVAAGTGRGGTQKHTGTAWGSHGVWEAQPKQGVSFGCHGNAEPDNVTHCGGRPVRVSSAGFTVLAVDAVTEALGWPNAGAGVELVFSGVDPAPWAGEWVGEWVGGWVNRFCGVVSVELVGRLE